MTRSSLTNQNYEEVEDTPDEESQDWLLLYDFRDIKPSTNF